MSYRRKLTNRKTLSILGICLMIILLSGEDVVKAGFVDDWLSQKTENSPGYFEGQKRGYFTGGGFSARWKQSNDYIASFEPPRLKFGCGGVDAFMGGFSFLNTEYLVQKLQRIMQAAPAMAFDMALKVLCEDCSNITTKMEALSSALNQLQLSDCQAGKAIGAVVLDRMGLNDKKGEIQSEARRAYNIGEGIKDLYQSLTDAWNSTGGQTTESTQAITAGCPGDVNAIFNTPGKTVLEALGELRGLPQGHIDLMRGLLGDIKIETVTTGATEQAPAHTNTVAVYLAPCSENSGVTLDAIYRGDVYFKNINQACNSIPDSNADITTWVNNKISSISTKISAANVGLDPDERGFLNAMGLPIHNAVKVAIATNQSPLVMAMLSETAAKTYAFAMVRDLVMSARQSVATAWSITSGQAVHKVNCQISVFTPIVESLKSFDKTGTEVMQRLYSDYNKALVEMTSYDNFARKYEEFNNLALKHLSKMFGVSLAKRAVGQQ